MTTAFQRRALTLATEPDKRRVDVLIFYTKATSHATPFIEELLSVTGCRASIKALNAERSSWEAAS